MIGDILDYDYELEDLKYSAKYPFTKTAKEIITGKEVKIDYEVFERASRRASNGIIHENIPILDTSDKNLLMRELLSYPIARMIVSFIGGVYLNRYVNAEVKRAIRYMQDNEGDKETIAKEFGISLSGNKVDVESYLRYIPKTKEFSMVNQKLNSGTVSLDSIGINAVLFEAIMQTIQSGLPVRKDTMPKELKTDLEEAAQKIQIEMKEARISFERTTNLNVAGEIAPCMRKLLEQLKNGENVSHMGRWVIAAYLLKRNDFTIDQIIALFSNTPNFNEKTTRYQLEFIKKKGYGIPSCVNLDSYDICIQKCGMKNPAQYGRRRSSTSYEGRKSPKYPRYPKRFSHNK